MYSLKTLTQHSVLFLKFEFERDLRPFTMNQTLSDLIQFLLAFV